MGSVPPTFLSSVCKPTLRMWMSKNKTKTTTKNCSCLKKDWVITGKGCNAGIRIRCVEGIPRVWGHGDHLSHSGEATEGQQVHPQQLVQQSYPGECLFSSSTMIENMTFFFHMYIVKYVTINSTYFISICVFLLRRTIVCNKCL